MKNPARVTVSPCNHSKFCVSCIFTIRSMDRPCPFCRGPFDRFEIHPGAKVDIFLGLLMEGDLCIIRNKSIDTIGELAAVYNQPVSHITENLYHNWCRFNLH
jgi:hypothetical protein